MRPVFIALSLSLAVALTASGGTFTVQEENDVFALNDRSDLGYTNGTRLTWRWIPSPTSRFNKPLGWLCRASDEELCGGAVTLGLVQTMYTPENLRARTRQIGDRPYGGWLSAVMMVDATRPETSDHVEIYGGVIGPESHAEEAQTFVHQEIVPNAPDPEGWDHQISESFAWLVVAQRRFHAAERRNADGLSYFDVTPSIGGMVGNVFANASVGTTVRLGYNLPRTFLQPIPSIASLAPVLPDKAPRWDAYVFAGADLRVVGRNIFIDKVDELHRIESRPLVLDHRFGGSVRIRWFRVQYAHTVRSAEFKPNGRPQSYGTITLSIGSEP